MKKNILFIIDAMVFGGGERVFAQIINGISEEKYRVFLASQYNVPFHQSISRDNVKFFYFNFKKRINPKLLINLATLIKKHEFDIVHAQGARTEFYARIANKISGKAKYISATAMPVEGFDISRSKRRIYRCFDGISEKYVDHFIVVSEALKTFLIKNRGIPTHKVTKIYNGIELDTKQSLSKHRKLPMHLRNSSDALIIGAVGRLVWQKGFEYLIRATPQIIRHFPNAMVLIAGDGPLKNKLTDLSRSLGVDKNIIFAGFINDIKDILSTFDILAVPSLLEGFPMVVLEGMALAKPIVATDIDGINEQLVDGKSGLLVTPKNEDHLAEAIIALLKSDQQKRFIGKNARMRAEKYFSVDLMIRQTENVYRSLISTDPD